MLKCTFHSFHIRKFAFFHEKVQHNVLICIYVINHSLGKLPTLFFMVALMFMHLIIINVSYWSNASLICSLKRHRPSVTWFSSAILVLFLGALCGEHWTVPKRRAIFVEESSFQITPIVPPCRCKYCCLSHASLESTWYRKRCQNRIFWAGHKVGIAGNVLWLSEMELVK